MLMKDDFISDLNKSAINAAEIGLIARDKLSFEKVFVS